ncbi:hypothetical protein VN24_06260 [Paenibacillus beijingensis]|uniref:Uncharacterized protein n=1 Tax=Paenibacillus beijingensis TaxID=1126833 RepID=A0A0D5NFV4_9BACL|nr:hypothetical protein VN24_06260 [Paenibacillus beijingensis]
MPETAMFDSVNQIICKVILHVIGALGEGLELHSPEKSEGTGTEDNLIGQRSPSSMDLYFTSMRNYRDLTHSYQDRKKGLLHPRSDQQSPQLLQRFGRFRQMDRDQQIRRVTNL